MLEASTVLDYATKEYRKTDFKYDALIWQARTYDQLGSVSNAEEVIDLLKSSGKTIPKKLYSQVFAVTADWNMRIGQYADMKKTRKQKPVIILLLDNWQKGTAIIKKLTIVTANV